MTIQTRSTTLDSVGGQSTVWADLASVYADIAPLSGREMMAAQAMQSSVTHKIIVRYQPLFADPKAVAAMRAVWIKDGITRIFNISSASDDDERRKYMTISATEGLNYG